MKRIVLIICLIAISTIMYSQAYIKLSVDRGDSLNTCDNNIDIIKYGTASGPYVITWWDNSWSPSSGFHAQDICEGKGLTVELIDTNCNHLRAFVKILPESVQQVYLDSVIATLPSSPGSCDGSLSFFFENVLPGDTKGFSNSGSGGVTTSTVFNGLCEDYYTYSINRNASLICEVTVSLNYAPVIPCIPFKDSLIITPQSTPGSCDAEVEYNTLSFEAPGATPYYHSIYKPVGGGSVQVNSGVDTSFAFVGLCSGPYIVETKSYPNNNYFVSNKIFVDEPLLEDSIWGSPNSSQIDTITLQALTNCGINYSFNVDSVFISNMMHIGANQYEFEISVIQLQDTLFSYQIANVDTSHQLCFDLTFFCADSSGFGTSQKSNNPNQLRSFIYFNPNQEGIVTSDVIHNISNELMVYPIPSTGIIYIETLYNKQSMVNIHGIDGKLYLSKNFNSKLIYLNLDYLTNGVYYITIKQDSQIFKGKIIIQK